LIYIADTCYRHEASNKTNLP